jgi:signal transduction histidine kinase
MLSRHLSVQEEERRRIARDLHDHVGQQMTAMHLQLDALLRLANQRGSELAPHISRVQALASQIARDLHVLTSQLRASVLEHLGLAAAVTDLAQAYSEPHTLPITVDVVGFTKRRLISDLENHFYRVAQEALSNARNHSGATRIEVVLQCHDGRVVLIVADDGIGFDVDAIMADGHDGGLGLLGMCERAALVGGSLHIESGPGEGSSVIMSAPAKFRAAPAES